MKTSNDYSPAVAVWPSGKVQACNVKRALLLQPDAATARLREAGVVWVFVASADDAAAVSARGTGGETVS